MFSIFFSTISLLISLGALLYNILHQRKKDRLFQASKISIWSTKVEIKNNSFYCDCNISNRSDVPIYNVFVFACWNTVHDTSLSENLSHATENSFIEVVPPGSLATTIETYGNGMGNQHDEPAILFTDSQNIQWYRHANGKLEKKKYLTLLLKKGLILGHLVPNNICTTFKNSIKKFCK